MFSHKQVLWLYNQSLFNDLLILMLAIKLARVGKKKQMYFRLVVLEKARDPWGKALEIVGHYNPRSKDKKPELKTERILHWISKGAQLTASVNNLLVNNGVIKGAKMKSVKLSKKRKIKLAEKKKTAAPAEAQPAIV
ncbi:MAG: 30S ribosomal protein S16 [bacterium]